MKNHRHWLMTGAAVIAALGIGFGAATVFRPAAPTEAHEEEGHADEASAALIPLTEAAARTAGVTLISVERGGGTELKLPGRVAFAPNAEAVVDAPLAGTVVRVHVGPGDRVAVGTPIITVRSSEGAVSRATVDAAQAAAESARAAERRDRTLFEKGWVAAARLEITAAEARRADAELRAARARVGAQGAPGANGMVVVRSPTAGVVVRLVAAPGQFMHEEALQVATIADTSRVELVFDAPPSAAGLIKIGDQLESSVPGTSAVSGIVTAIAPVNDRGVVVIRARPTGAVPPTGTVISARITAGVGGGAFTVPIEAVQSVGGVPSVFVFEGTGFRVRPVVTGRTADGRIEVTSGLNGTERVAGVGAFLLKAEMAKGEAEHDH